MRGFLGFLAAATLAAAPAAHATFYVPSYEQTVEGMLRQFATVQRSLRLSDGEMAVARVLAASFVFVGPCHGVVSDLPDQGAAGLQLPSVSLSSSSGVAAYALVAIYVSSAFNAPSSDACKFARADGWPSR